MWKSTSQLGALPAPTPQHVDQSAEHRRADRPDHLLCVVRRGDCARPATIADLNENPAVLRDRIRVTGPGHECHRRSHGSGRSGPIQAQGPTQTDAVKLNRAFAYALEQQGERVRQLHELKAQQTQVYDQIAIVQKRARQPVRSGRGDSHRPGERAHGTGDADRASWPSRLPTPGITVLESASNATASTVPLIDSRPIRGLAGLLHRSHSWRSDRPRRESVRQATADCGTSWRGLRLSRGGGDPRPVGSVVREVSDAGTGRAQ